MLREVPSNSLYTILLIICLIAIALSKYIASKRFNDFIFVVGNSKYLKIYGKDIKFLDNYNGLLFINFIISIAVFSLISFKTYTNSSIIDQNILFQLILVISVLILIKTLIEKLIGVLFQIESLINNYLFQKTSYKNYLGLLLLPLNALLIFSITPSLTIIYIIVILLLIVNINGVYTSFKASQNEIKNNLFYFILYLCALEISPYIIIYSVFVPN